jgi:hypothetical protein
MDQTIDEEAIEEKSNEYGIFYQAEGELIGVNGVSLSVVTIWLQRQINGLLEVSIGLVGFGCKNISTAQHYL